MTQLFADQVPLILLEEVLDTFFEKKDDHYIVDYVGYKKMIFHNYHDKWRDEVKPYYHKAKQYYVDRKFTYISFVNILRQICRLYNIEYHTYQDKTTGYKFFKYHILY